MMSTGWSKDIKRSYIKYSPEQQAMPWPELGDDIAATIPHPRQQQGNDIAETQARLHWR